MIDELPQPIVSRIQFILAGNGKEVGVPGKVMPYVSVNFSLDFIPYYNLLHESFALIPAFADERYYKTKASSSVATSFIANAPILGSKRLLESYGYLSKESMWEEEHAGESEMTAVYELLRKHFDDNGHEKDSWKTVVKLKKQAVKKRALELMADNAGLMREIILKEGSWMIILDHSLGIYFLITGPGGQPHRRVNVWEIKLDSTRRWWRGLLYMYYLARAEITPRVIQVGNVGLVTRSSR